jgi:hypothetical protein
LLDTAAVSRSRGDMHETPDGGLSADFLDPDHHMLSVYQPSGAPR